VLTFTYLCGPPGVGKSAVMAALTARCDLIPVAGAVPHSVLARAGRPVGAEIGHRRPGFPGTDTLSMSIAPSARAWVSGAPYRLILAEGRRLASASFLDAAAQAGYEVTLAHLEAPPDVLAARREARGSTQSESWMRGSATAAANLADAATAAGYRVLRMPADGASPAQLAAQLTATVPGMEVLA
jgi:ribose 1,5-bisphosphokinase PhnN